MSITRNLLLELLNQQSADESITVELELLIKFNLFFIQSATAPSLFGAVAFLLFAARSVLQTACRFEVLS